MAIFLREWAPIEKGLKTSIDHESEVNRVKKTDTLILYQFFMICKGIYAARVKSLLFAASGSASSLNWILVA